MQEFRAVWSRRLDEIGMTVISFGLLVATIVAAVQSQKWIMMMFCLLWGAMLAGCGYMLFFTVSEVVLEGNSLTLRNGFGVRTLSPSDIESIQGTVARKSSSIQVRTKNGKSLMIYLKSYPDPSTVLSAMETWWSTAKLANGESEVKTRVFRTKSFSMISIVLTVFISAIFIGTGLTQPKSLPLFWIAAPVIGLLFTMSVLAAGSYARVEPEGLVVKRMGKEKRVAWSEITSVKLSTVTTKGSTQEGLWVIWPTGKTYLNQIFDDLPILRDMVLAHVPASIVEDKRGRI